MVLLALITGALLSFAATALLIPPISRLAVQKGWVDRPDNQRKLHARPTPTIGGIAIVAGFVAGCTYLATLPGLALFSFADLPAGFWIGALVIVATGFYDDVRGMGFKAKFVVQFFVAYLLLHAGYRIDVSQLPFVETDAFDQALYSIPLTILWIVGIINAVNLIDGVDGLAGGVTLIGFACLAVVFGMQGAMVPVIIAVIIGGALLGFLLHNFNPASIFMGDSGSLFLGYLLAVVSLSGKAHVDPWLSILVPMIALGLPVLDTSLSIVRRITERKTVFAPDHDHIHHRLVGMFSTRKAVLLLYGVSLCFGTAAIGISLLTPIEGLGVLSLTLVLVAAFLTVLGYLQAPRITRAEPATSSYAEVRRSVPGATGDGHARAVAEIADRRPTYDEPAYQEEDRLEVAGA